MKKLSFILILLLMSVTLMAQKSHHKSSKTVYYVVIKAFDNYNEANYFQNNAPCDMEYGGIHKVIANGKTFYLVLDWNSPYYSSSEAMKGVKDAQDFLDRWRDDRNYDPSIWTSKVKANTETVNKTICECNECGPFERIGKCHNKGKWRIKDGQLVFYCSNCFILETGSGCDVNCQCRKKDKIVN